ncbi:transporter substrate-binding domain-containing protein [Entomomonas sp. E2T0]|uniref:transporter substrate-binding domain-containing protein n=1 Tax=Entomomonas sp. E2T0 TaxID=2930213 RepID=UPI0022282E01|nr:transporter substrate-binding domain-containing protein [Entomomonas sp. E2T0]UYZ84626.1 transporter substrate-binding domain-containing protein [Entomomonas sp. E2T0]
MKRVLAFIVVILFSITAAFAGMTDDAVKRGTLRVGLTPTYMPFEMTNKQGEIIGFEVDIVRAMAKALGVKLELIPTSYDGIIPGLLTGKFDMIASGMTINQSRNLRVNFTDLFVTTGQTLLIRKDLADEIKSYKDLNNEKYKITSQIGTTGEFIAKKYMSKAKYYGYNSEAEAILEVVNHKADAFIFDESYNIVALQRLGNKKLIHLDKLITAEPIAFAVRKEDYDSINWINNFLTQIKNDGTYDRIYNKWFKRTDWLKDME